MAFYALEPDLEYRADRHAALIASTIANVNRAKGKAAHKLEDFVLVYEPRQIASEAAPDLAQRIDAAMHALGGEP